METANGSTASAVRRETEMLNVRVSTIIPTFNSAATLPAAIESALAQQFEGQHEIIVVNDGSTDATQSVLESYGTRITVIQQENQGQPTARNAAIKCSTGQYIAFLDADDIWLPGRLSKTVAALDRNPAAALVFSDYVRIDQTGTPVQGVAVPASLAHPPSMDEILTHWWPIAPTTVTMPRSIWYRCGGFQTDAAGFEDLYFFILARECGEIEYLAEPLANFRLSSAELGPDKWSPDVFIRLIKQRYRSRARGLLREIRDHYAGAFASKALRAMEQGDRSEAVRCWLKVLHYDSLYAFNATHLVRLFRQRNVRRLAQMLWPKPSGESE
jgi:glycosyltransferase involved in cell wall biosynthesis